MKIQNVGKISQIYFCPNVIIWTSGNKIIAKQVLKKKSLFRFEAKSKVGINTVRDMMPTLSKMFGPKRFTNNSIRATAIRSMKRGGASDREITTVSGHRDESSLQHYDPIATNQASSKMANSIANAGLDSHPQNSPKQGPANPFKPNMRYLPLKSCRIQRTPRT